VIFLDKPGESFDFEIVNATSMAFVHKRIIFDESGLVDDFIVRHVNTAFEKLMNVKGEDIRGIEESSFFGYAKKNYKQLLKGYTPFFKEKKPFFIDIYSPRFQKWLRIRYEHVREDYYISWVIDINAEKIIMQTSNEIFQSGIIKPKKIAERASRLSGASFVLFCHFNEEKEYLSEYEYFLEDSVLEEFSTYIVNLFSEIPKSILINSFYEVLPLHIGNSTYNINCPAGFNARIHLLIRENSVKGFFLFLFKEKKEIDNLSFLLTYMEQISLLLLKTELLEKRLKAENELREKENNYRIMTENTTDGVAMIRNHRFKYVSPSYVKMLDLDDEKDLQTIEDAFINVPEEFRKKIIRDFEKAKAEKSMKLTYRYPVEKKNGTKIWVEDNVKFSWGKDKTMNQDIISINGRDVTRQVQFENELKEAKRRIEKADAVKTEFMMNMSHELRTPLNGILGFSNIVKGTDLDEEQIEYVQNIETSARRLLGIVNDILDFTKILTYKLKVNYQPVNIKALLENLIKMTRKSAEKKALTVELQIDDGIPEYLLTDKLKLSQVIGNLLMNAVKFTEKGDILLKAQLLTKNSKKAMIKFLVKDTGIGIDDSLKKIIFDSFTQADSSISRQYDGTGLGLSISNGILELMNSRLNLFSQPGKGSEFSFILSFRITSQPNNIDPGLLKRNETVENSKPLKIMIVEDNAINRKLNETIIRRYYPSAKIVAALNGKEAVEKHSKYRFDLILMDIRMPKMNGLESTQIIRKNMKDNETIIIGVSAEAHQEKIDAGISIGMDDYITKPVIPNELIKVINRYI
jgi:PAS domain S-box-containing protein